MCFLCGIPKCLYLRAYRISKLQLKAAWKGIAETMRQGVQTACLCVAPREQPEFESEFEDFVAQEGQVWRWF